MRIYYPRTPTSDLVVALSDIAMASSDMAGDGVESAANRGKGIH